MAPSTLGPAALLCADLQDVFRDRLRAVVAYGPRVDGHAEAALSCLVLVDTLALEDLEACARRTAAWARAGLATPLLLTSSEFARSLDVFPLEYGEILRSHVPILGNDPFAGLTIAPADLRRACEAQIKSHLLHLREGFLESRGRPDAVADLLAAAAPGFAALLRNVARLARVASTDRAEATRQGAAAAGIDPDLVRDVLALDSAPGVPTTDAARLFAPYLAAVEQLARAVDAWA